MDNIKEFIEKAIAKIKANPDLLKQFKENPKAAIASLFGDMDDFSLSAIVEAVKDKLDGDDDNNEDGGNILETIKDKLEDSDIVDGLKDKIGDLFGKKD